MTLAWSLKNNSVTTATPPPTHTHTLESDVSLPEFTNPGLLLPGVSKHRDSQEVCADPHLASGRPVKSPIMAGGQSTLQDPPMQPGQQALAQGYLTAWGSSKVYGSSSEESEAQVWDRQG